MTITATTAPMPPPPPTAPTAPAPAASTHQRDTTFTDLPAGQVNLCFVDVTNVWSTTSSTASAERDTKNIRKILIHHHAGFPHDLSQKHKTQKAATGEDMPAKYVDLASDAYKTKPYGYHYDIPYVAETAADGKLIVYVTSPQNRNVPHTGAGQNETGIGISLVGTMRSYAEAPEGVNFGTKHKTVEEHTNAPGLPSQNQRRVLPVLVRYLQEQHGIANCHVQAHFQHSKPTCPGYDTERWIIDHEESSRKAGTAWCYPVQLDSGGVPFLKEASQETNRYRKYLKNTRDGGSGFYPFGRRGFWHNGVHLFPQAGAPVYAVHDGWVIAARFEKNVTVDGKDYGSAAFVMVQHEDPGFWPLDGKLHDTVRMSRWVNGGWSPFNASVAVQPNYFSLSMHLKPLDESVPWVKLLKKKDPTLYNTITGAKGTTYNFNQVALPVRGGDIIGYVGTHDPFAAMDKTATVSNSDIYAEKHKSVLHFEMFSTSNLVERLEDKTIGQKWIVKDADANALAEAVAKKLPGVAGMKDHTAKLEEKLAEMEKADPLHADPSRFSAAIVDELLEPLSTLITSHTNEWSADWKGVAESWFREWGLAKGKLKADNKRIEKTVKHHLEVVKQFQWGVALKDHRNRTISGAIHYFHPVRFLNWLNGLVRVADVPDLPYNTMFGVTPFDVAPRTVRTTAATEEGLATIKIAKATGRPAIASHTSLVGTRVFFPPSKEVHLITAVTETKTGLDLTVSPPVPKEIAKNASVRLGGNGWRWEARFKWETNMLGVAAPTTTPAAPAKGATTK